MGEGWGYWGREGGKFRGGTRILVPVDGGSDPLDVQYRKALEGIFHQGDDQSLILLLLLLLLPIIIVF